MPKTIMVKGSNGVQKEAKVGTGPITPGMLIHIQSNGTAIKQAVAKADCARRWAVEWSLIGTPGGPTGGLDIDRVYATNDQMPYRIFNPGDEVYALLAPSAAAVVIGDYLEATGDGTVRKWTDGVRVGVAMEAVDNSANAVTTARLIVEVK